MADLDQALTLAGELQEELDEVQDNALHLEPDLRPMLAYCVDMTASIRGRLERMIAMDDALHPEER